MRQPKFVPLHDYHEYPVEEMKRRAADFYADMQRRRTVRQFSGRPVPREIIEDCLRAAGTAPSGANLQPWHFVVVGNPSIKKQIRKAAEEEERAFYGERAPQEWLDALAPLGTDEHKLFLETAPYLSSSSSRIMDLRPKDTKSSTIMRWSRWVSPPACSSQPCITPASFR